MCLINFLVGLSSENRNASMDKQNEVQRICSQKQKISTCYLLAHLPDDVALFLNRVNYDKHYAPLTVFLLFSHFKVELSYYKDYFSPCDPLHSSA